MRRFRRKLWKLKSESVRDEKSWTGARGTDPLAAETTTDLPETAGMITGDKDNKLTNQHVIVCSDILVLWLDVNKV